MPSIYIAITGLPASGKTTMARALEDKGLPVVALGDIARVEAKKIGITAEQLGEKVRAELGRDYLVRKAADMMNKCVGPVVIEGIRDYAEVAALKARGRVLVVAMTAETEIRKKRYEMRARPGTSPLEIRDAQEARWGVLAAIEAADITVEGRTIVEPLDVAVVLILGEAERLAKK